MLHQNTPQFLSQTHTRSEIKNFSLSICMLSTIYLILMMVNTEILPDTREHELLDLMPECQNLSMSLLR